MAKSVPVFSTFVCLALISSSAWAVNYDDPNLSDRRDVVARAALNCNSFRNISEQFSACLASQGITDIGEKSEAAAIAKAIPLNVGPANYESPAVSNKIVSPTSSPKGSR